MRLFGRDLEHKVHRPTRIVLAVYESRNPPPPPSLFIFAKTPHTDPRLHIVQDLLRVRFPQWPSHCAGMHQVMGGGRKEARRAGWAPRQPCTSRVSTITITIIIFVPLSRSQQIRTIRRRRRCPRRTLKQRAAAVVRRRGERIGRRRRRMHCARLPVRRGWHRGGLRGIPGTHHGDSRSGHPIIVVVVVVVLVEVQRRHITICLAAAHGHTYSVRMGSQERSVG